MNRTIWTAALPFAGAILLGPGLSTVQAQPSEEDILAAIEAGLDWLVTQQDPVDGSWGDANCDRVAATALVLLKFETYAIEHELEPLSPDYEFSTNVQAGLDFLVANSHVQAIGVEPAGDPDSNGNGTGVYFTDCGFHIMYNTGCAAMAIAASGAPGTYGFLLQETVDFLAWAQADDQCHADNLHRGGWRYNPDECSSDNSNSGYVTLGLGFASAAPPYGFGLTVPQWVKDELSIWIDVIQDDVNGDADDGGSWYDPYSSLVNILKTGNLLYEMALAGDTLGTQRVQDAIDYIEAQWNGTDPWTMGHMWQNHRQAMFAMMKGFEAYDIELIDLDDDNVPEHNWFDEVAQHLIDTQDPGGFWPGDPWAGSILSTAWAMLTLERAVPVIEPQYRLDIKPGSCPNAFNRRSKGVLPIALVGTEQFDVTEVDLTSLLLTREGFAGSVAPLDGPPGPGSNYEDVATPFDGQLCDCHELMGDGITDLSLKFRTPAVVEALGLWEFAPGDEVELCLSGTLLDETEFEACDCVRLVSPHTVAMPASQNAQGPPGNAQSE